MCRGKYSVIINEENICFLVFCVCKRRRLYRRDGFIPLKNIVVYNFKQNKYILYMFFIVTFSLNFGNYNYFEHLNLNLFYIVILFV